MAFDSNSANYVEFSVLAEPTKKTRLIKAVIVLGAIIVFTASLFFIIALAGPLAAFVPIEIILIAFVMVQLWKYTSIEYDCTIASGYMNMSVIYGGKKRKVLFEQKISSFITITNKTTSPVEEKGYTHIYRCVSSMDSDNIVYATFINNKDEKCIVYFQPIKKAFSILKFYNMSAYKIG